MALKSVVIVLIDYHHEQVVFHNLRTPLHVISGILEYEMNEYSDHVLHSGDPHHHINNRRADSKVGATLRTVQEYLFDIVNIVEDVTIASMFERKLEPVMKLTAGVLSTTINTIIDGIEVIEQVLGSSAVACIAEFDHYDKTMGAQEPCYAIPSLLPRVLFHLLKNAVAYSTNNSTVKCSITTVIPNDNNDATLKVTNNKYNIVGSDGRDDVSDDNSDTSSVSKKADTIQIKIENTTSSIVSLEFFLQYCQSFHNMYVDDELGSVSNHG